MDDAAQARRVFEAVVLTALADGKQEYQEARFLADLAHLHPLLAQLDSPDEIALEVWRRVREKGADDCLEEVADGLRDRPYQELAFALCARVMGVDGETAGEEAMVLGTLQERFGFSNEDVRRLITSGF
jgi:hypothetical protein